MFLRSVSYETLPKHKSLLPLDNNLCGMRVIQRLLSVVNQWMHVVVCWDAAHKVMLSYDFKIFLNTFKKQSITHTLLPTRDILLFFYKLRVLGFSLQMIKCIECFGESIQ